MVEINTKIQKLKPHLNGAKKCFAGGSVSLAIHRFLEDRLKDTPKYKTGRELITKINRLCQTKPK